jgi:hypothetical protein
MRWHLLHNWLLLMSHLRLVCSLSKTHLSLQASISSLCAWSRCRVEHDNLVLIEQVIFVWWQLISSLLLWWEVLCVVVFFLVVKDVVMGCILEHLVIIWALRASSTTRFGNHGALAVVRVLHLNEELLGLLVGILLSSTIVISILISRLARNAILRIW